VFFIRKEDHPGKRCGCCDKGYMEGVTSEMIPITESLISSDGFPLVGGGPKPSGGGPKPFFL